MAHLIIIRHSESQPEKDKPARMWQLTPAGEARCQLLADQLKIYQPDIVLSSIEPKAALTGQLLAHQLNIPFETRPNLHEHERENVPFFESVAQFQAAVTNLFNQPDKRVFGDETAGQAHSRFQQAVQACLAEHPQKTIAITTHGTVMTLFTSHVSNRPPVPLWQALEMPAYAVFSLPDLVLEKVVYKL